MAKHAEHCRFTRANGLYCQSPAMRNDDLCYYHRSARERAKIQMRYQRLNKSKLDLPAIDDRASIQVALNEILHALADDRIEPRRITSMLYCLQIAALNVRDLDLEVSEHDDYAEEYEREDPQAIAREELDDYLKELEKTEPEVAREMRETGCSQLVASLRTLHPPEPDIPKKPPIPAENVTEHKLIADDLLAKQKSFRNNLKQAAATARSSS